MSRSFPKFVSDLVRQNSQCLYRIDKKTLKLDDKTSSRLRYIVSSIIKSMSATEVSMDLVPPKSVRGMTTLQKESFKKSVKIPGLKLAKREISRSQKSWKPLVLKVPKLKPVAELSDSDELKSSHSLILLDPRKLASDSLTQDQSDMLLKVGFDSEKPEKFEVTLGYENWSVSDVMRAVLPSEVETVTSYTQVGHIAHLNLKPETLPYKTLIGQVILDKVPSVKTVVNKLNTIDNTYRNFSMELLAGEDNFVTQTKEHNCVFELDFSKVYWNSRLATEHQRIVESIPKGSLVYDVFAGIGPFSVPLAKKKNCTVMANDLNPSSYESLNKNILLNKIKDGKLKTWNLDGKEFILTVVKKSLEERMQSLFITASVGDKSCLDHNEKNLNSSQINNNTSDSNNVIVFKGDSVSNDHTESNASDSQKCEESESSTNNGDVSVINGDNNKSSAKPSYVIMNLPAIAVEFLDSFRSLLHDTATSFPQLNENPEVLAPIMPQVFCYAFSPKGDMDTELKQRVEGHLGSALPADYSCRWVRNVAPNKEMVCLSFRLWPQLVLETPPSCDSESQSTDGQTRKRDLQEDTETDSKKQKMTSD